MQPHEEDVQLDTPLTTDEMKFSGLRVMVEDTDTLVSLTRKIREEARAQDLEINEDGAIEKAARETYDRFFEADGTLRPQNQQETGD